MGAHPHAGSCGVSIYLPATATTPPAVPPPRAPPANGAHPLYICAKMVYLWHMAWRRNRYAHWLDVASVRNGFFGTTTACVAVVRGGGTEQVEENPVRGERPIPPNGVFLYLLPRTDGPFGATGTGRGAIRPDAMAVRSAGRYSGTGLNYAARVPERRSYGKNA